MKTSKELESLKHLLYELTVEIQTMAFTGDVERIQTYKERIARALSSVCELEKQVIMLELKERLQNLGKGVNHANR